MLKSEFIFKQIAQRGTQFFAGVPDSLLKDFCAYVTDHTDENNHIISANEGSSVALAAGYHLSTGNIALVYLQNSGLGNTINPLLSLTDPEVYSIPVLLMIGWRGEPGVSDEPQHVKQGKVTLPILEKMGIPFEVLSPQESEASIQIQKAYEYMKERKAPFALVVKKGTFEAYQLKKGKPNHYPLIREAAIAQAAASIPQNSVVVSTTGMISRELYEIRKKSKVENSCDFYTVGSMGHASQIALGIGIQRPDKTIYCFDGDGAVLMHMGGLATIGQAKLRNYIHVVFNNGAHDSVGGQPTVGFETHLCEIAKACGYEVALQAKSETEIKDALISTVGKGPVFIEIMVNRGSRPDLGRPKESPLESKVKFMEHFRQ